MKKKIRIKPIPEDELTSSCHGYPIVNTGCGDICSSCKHSCYPEEYRDDPNYEISNGPMGFSVAYIGGN